MTDRIKYTSQYIDNLSFDEGLKVKVTELIDTNGSLINPASEETLQAVLAAHDTVVVDTTDPDNIVVTKKLNGATVDTKTISII